MHLKVTNLTKHWFCGCWNENDDDDDDDDGEDDDEDDDDYDKSLLSLMGNKGYWHYRSSHF